MSTAIEPAVLLAVRPSSSGTVRAIELGADGLLLGFVASTLPAYMIVTLVVTALCVALAGNHNFELTTFEEASLCAVCSKLLCGCYFQGYYCQGGCGFSFAC